MTAAYGLPISTDFVLPELADPEPAPGEEPLRMVAGDDVAAAFSGALGGARANLEADDKTVVIDRGPADDVLISVDGLPRFHLDPGARVLRCADPRPDDPGWRRMLLDTVLTVAALARGFDALHGAAIATAGSVTVIVGARGAGKSTLLAVLLERGAALVADDIVALSDGEGAVLAHPAPPVVMLPPGAQAPATAIAAIGGRRWARAASAASGPLPVARVVELTRGTLPTGAALSPAAEPGTLLLAHALHSGHAPERAERRFELLARLAATATVQRLDAAADVTAPELADLIRA